MLAFALALWLLWFLRSFFPRRHRPARFSRGRPFVPATVRFARIRKPEWVIGEVIRLKALMGELGCRKVADTFNRLHAARHSTTVSKTYVATTVREHLREIAQRRRAWKRRIPHEISANAIWGVDLTAKTDADGVSHPILGVVDHGTRFAVALAALPDKATITVLRCLLDAIERHGKPYAVRTDNESIFISRQFGFVLWTLGIRHQRTDKHCPWQNGRVERLFGTLKGKLDCWAVGSGEQLQLALGDFRIWYNAVRPHQHLHGRTPIEAWLRIDPFAKTAKEVGYFSAWEGRLTGIYLRH